MKKYTEKNLIDFFNELLNLCTLWRINDEINKIKAILLNNEYPKSIIDREISNFLESKFIDKVTTLLYLRST